MLLKKGTPVTVPAPVIQGCVKALKTVDDDHVAYLVGFMIGDEYIERWYTQEQLAIPTSPTLGLQLVAASVQRGVEMQEDKSKKAEKGLDYFDRGVKALAAAYSIDEEAAAAQLRGEVNAGIMSDIDDLREAKAEAAQAKAEADEAAAKKGA